MLYNKNVSRKVNDKKVLHKVRGSWVTVSTALLMAIGGGALVTANSTNANAHADSTPLTATQNTQSASNNNYGISSATQSLVNSLETPPVANSATSASVSSASSSNANTTSEAYMPVASSYVSGDGGSAASYHTDAYNDSVSVHNNTNIVNSYVNSLNTEYSASTGNLMNNYAKAQSKENADETNYKAESSVANNANGKARVSALASNAGLTVPDFTTFVSYQTDFYTNNVKAQSNLVNQLQTVYDNAETLSSMASNPYLSAENTASVASASANSVIASDELSGSNELYKTAQSASNTNTNAINSLTVQLDSMSTADYIATHIYANMDFQAASTLANSLGYGSNMDAVNNAVSNYAKGFNPSASANTFKMSMNNSKGSNFSNVASGNASNAIYQLVSDAYAQSNFATNYYNLLNSLNTDKANSASYSNEVKNDSIAVSNATSFSASASSNYAKLSSLANFANSVASNSNSVTLGDVFNYLLSGTSYSSIKNDLSAVNSDNLSAGMQSLSNSISNASNSLAQDNVTSASYASSVDATDVLAGSQASSLSADVQVDSIATSNAKSALDNFYATNAGFGYTQASNAASNASKAYTHDSLFANAYGTRAYNYAPKHIVVLKNARLHSTTNYDNDSILADVDSGYQFDVLGVGFSSNGTLRYLVSDGNGHEGFITANPKYTASTYLQYSPDQLQQPVAPMLDISVDNDINDYKSSHFNRKNLVKHLSAGDTVKGQIVYENDNTNSNKPVYGGFTRIKLADGSYITANTSYVHVLGTANVQPSKPTPQANQNQQTIPAVSFN